MFLILLLISQPTFLWDNDAGLHFFDPQGNPVGTEVRIIEALEDNDIVPVVSTNLPNIDSLVDYEMLWVNCAWRNDEMIDSTERSTISKYLDYGGKVYLEGNMVARAMETYGPDFIRKFGIKWFQTDDSTYRRVEGLPGTFMEGETFEFDTLGEMEKMVDWIDTVPGTGAEIIYNAVSQGKALFSRGGAESAPVRGREDTTYATVFSSLILSGFKSTFYDTLFSDRQRRAEFAQKILGYFGFGKILVVDDNQSDDDLLEDDLDSIGITYDTFNYSQGPPTPEDLHKFNLVFWTTGFEDTATLSYYDQIVLENYIRWGGRLLVTGENIASEIGFSGSGQEQWFLSLLGVDYIGSPMIPDSVIGINEFYGFNAGIISNQSDEVDSMNGGRRIFEYRPDTRIYGGISNRITRGVSQFFAFPYEGMYNHEERKEIVLKTLDEFDIYLRAGVSGIDRISNEREIIKPESEIFMKFTEFPVEDSVFRVYSITGRLIKEVRGKRWYGRNAEGRKVPSGIYFLRGVKGEKGRVIFIR